MNPSIFREYDIRGIAGQDMTDEVGGLGRGIDTFLKRHGCRSITLVRDCRTSSDAYAGQRMSG